MAYNVIEGSLEVKLPTIWTDEKQRWKSQRREEKRREETRREEKRRGEERREEKIKKEKVTEERRSRCAKVGKSRNTVFFQ